VTGDSHGASVSENPAQAKRTEFCSDRNKILCVGTGGAGRVRWRRCGRGRRRGGRARAASLVGPAGGASTRRRFCLRPTTSARVRNSSPGHDPTTRPAAYPNYGATPKTGRGQPMMRASPRSVNVSGRWPRWCGHPSPRLRRRQGFAHRERGEVLDVDRLQLVFARTEDAEIGERAQRPDDVADQREAAAGHLISGAGQPSPAAGDHRRNKEPMTPQLRAS